jgi:hypothetical protein
LLTENSFPKGTTEYYGNFNGGIDLVPKPAVPRLPMITIGRARQDMSWIANHSDAGFGTVLILNAPALS